MGGEPLDPSAIHSQALRRPSDASGRGHGRRRPRPRAPRGGSGHARAPCRTEGRAWLAAGGRTGCGARGCHGSRPRATATGGAGAVRLPCAWRDIVRGAEVLALARGLPRRAAGGRRVPGRRRRLRALADSATLAERAVGPRLSLPQPRGASAADAGSPLSTRPASAARGGVGRALAWRCRSRAGRAPPTPGRRSLPDRRAPHVAARGGSSPGGAAAARGERRRRRVAALDQTGERRTWRRVAGPRLPPPQPRGASAADAGSPLSTRPASAARCAPAIRRRWRPGAGAWRPTGATQGELPGGAQRRFCKAAATGGHGGPVVVQITAHEAPTHLTAKEATPERIGSRTGRPRRRAAAGGDRR